MDQGAARGSLDSTTSCLCICAGRRVGPATRHSKPASDIVEYLDNHRIDLLERASSEKVAEATFADAQARSRFQTLATGTDSQFEATAGQLAQRLHQLMDNRSKRGFFVAASFSDGNTSQSLVLKLDASSQKLAALGGGSSDPTIESVQDLLDIPGELQKGALFPDPRTHSEVCVGDKNRLTSLYYLNAIEVAQNELPSRAVTALLTATQVTSPQYVEPLTRALESSTGRTPAAQILQAVSPSIPSTTQQQILGQLTSLSRRVDDVDPTAHATKGVIEIDGITIRGSARKIREDVNWTVNQAGGGYIIQIEVSQLPIKRYE